MKRLLLQPALTLDEADQRFQGRYLSHADYDTVVAQDTVGTLPNKEPKFVFLRNALRTSDDGLQRAYQLISTLPMGSVRNSLRRRAAKSFRPFVAGTAPEEWKTPEELVLAKATKRAVMVVTQTCDLERRNFVQVAPVYAVATLSQSKQASVETNEVNYLFYFPALEPVLPNNSFADLSQIVSVHNSYLKDAKLAIRLSNEGRARLQMHLAKFHGRPFGFSAEDRVTQAGEYLCLRCFLTTAVVEKKNVSTADAFGNCSKCGPQALWVKFS